MKIERFQIEEFGIEESPQLNRPDIQGQDVLIHGNNRSGKTLTYNAIIYGFYGRKGIEASPGDSSSVEVKFDNNHKLVRKRSGHVYKQNGQNIEADKVVSEKLGRRSITQLQCLPSNIDNQPLSRIKGSDLVQLIREMLDQPIQEKIQRHKIAKSHLEDLIEREKFGGGGKSLDALEREKEDLNIEKLENRYEKI
jgi:hypothetical protein